LAALKMVNVIVRAGNRGGWGNGGWGYGGWGNGGVGYGVGYGGGWGNGYVSYYINFGFSDGASFTLKNPQNFGQANIYVQGVKQWFATHRPTQPVTCLEAFQQAAVTVIQVQQAPQVNPAYVMEQELRSLIGQYEMSSDPNVKMKGDIFNFAMQRNPGAMISTYAALKTQSPMFTIQSEGALLNCAQTINGAQTMNATQNNVMYAQNNVTYDQNNVNYAQSNVTYAQSNVTYAPQSNVSPDPNIASDPNIAYDPNTTDYYRNGDYDQNSGNFQ